MAKEPRTQTTVEAASPAQTQSESAEQPTEQLQKKPPQEETLSSENLTISDNVVSHSESPEMARRRKITNAMLVAANGSSMTTVRVAVRAAFAGTVDVGELRDFIRRLRSVAEAADGIASEEFAAAKSK